MDSIAVMGRNGSPTTSMSGCNKPPRPDERVSTNRYRELKETGAKTVATGCPFCMRMITEETAKEEAETAMEVLDIAELVAKNLQK